jgi:hypothetical protein
VAFSLHMLSLRRFRMRKPLLQNLEDPMLKSRGALSAAFLYVTSTCCAEAPSASNPAQMCRAVADNAQRLACYDRIYASPAPQTATQARDPAAAETAGAASSVNVPPPATAAPAARPLSASVTVAPEADTVAQFGRSAAQRRISAGQPTLPQKLESITGTVTELHREANGEFVVALDNSQVWRQIELDSRAWPEKGDTVTIRRALLGSFLLVTPDHRATRVHRIL